MCCDSLMPQSEENEACAEASLLQGWKSLGGEPSYMDPDAQGWPMRLQVSSSNIKGDPLMDSGVEFGVRSYEISIHIIYAL